MRKLHSDTYIPSMLKKNKSMSFLDIIRPSDIAYVIAVVKNGISVWREEEGAKALFTHGEKKRRKYGQCMWSPAGKAFYENAKTNWSSAYASKIMATNLIEGWEEWVETKGKGLKLGSWKRKSMDRVLKTRGEDEDEDELAGNEQSGEDEGEGEGEEFGEYFESDTEEFGPAYEGRDKSKELWSKVGKTWDDEVDGNDENNGELVQDQGGRVSIWKLVIILLY